MMTIDIITYTDAQFAALTEEQLREVKSAQQKKNKLLVELEERVEREKYKLVKNGVYLSEMWPLIEEKLRAKYDAEVEALREALLFYLRFASKPSDSDAQNAPYTVDYSLTETERFTIVKDYYEEAYSDGVERFEAFKADTVAKQYLGELYAPLYDYFLESA